MMTSFVTGFLLWSVCAVQASSVEELAPRTAGLWLAEVQEVVSFDERGGDGNKGVRIKLKKVKGSGAFYDTLTVVTEYGGLRPEGTPEPIPPNFIRVNTFERGIYYWFAFASEHMLRRHPQWVVEFWSKGHKVEPILEKAVAGDVFRWTPQYDPESKLVYGRLKTKDKREWRIRVEKDGNLLWEKRLQGEWPKGYFDWRLHRPVEPNFDPPKCGKVIIATISTELPDDNEFGVPAGKVDLQTWYDAETGKRLVARLSHRPYGGWVLLLRRVYDPATGKVVKEERPN